MTVLSRREWLKGAAAASATAILTLNGAVFAAGGDRIGVALIGCGGRGTGAALDCLTADPSVEIVALADLFKDRLESCLKQLRESPFANRIKVTENTCFIGFDAYQKAVASNQAMLVIEACPPHFRPLHVKAAIEAGKHVFMEKPAGVDPAGIRSLLATADLADSKGLSIAAGTQRRHQAHYIETIRRIADGQIGQIRSATCFWNGSDMLGYWQWYEKNNLSGMEWQCRNWPWYTWLSGDHIVEQHVHNLDVANWAINAHPISSMGMGGRQLRTLGNIYDHFAVDFEYADGVRVTSMCRQINGCSDRVCEYIIGTTGVAYLDGSNGRIEGAKPWTFTGQGENPYVQEHKDLIAGIRSGKPLNEARHVAESTMTAILGRMSAYTGNALKWDWAMKSSKLDYTPEKYEFIDIPEPQVAIPGKTKLV